MGKLDFGVIPLTSESENIKSYPLFVEESFLVTRSMNPTSLPWKTPSKPFPVVAYRETDSLLDGFLKKHQTSLGIANLSFRMLVNSHESMISALLQDDLYAVLPRFPIKDHIERGDLRIAAPASLRTPFFLIHQDQKFSEKRLQLFKKELVTFAKTLTERGG